MTGEGVAKATDVRVRRVYEDPRADDGARVLVDRLWPRGLSRERAQLEEWQKDIAPSSELRIWYGHDPDRFTEFAERYRTELRMPGSPQARALEVLMAQAAAGRVTLLTATRNPALSEAAVLAGILQPAGRARV